MSGSNTFSGELAAWAGRLGETGVTDYEWAGAGTVYVDEASLMQW